MPQKDFNDLAAFAAVATERSFTRAAVKLGVSQSALSQTIRNLEQRLELRLLTRTTRSVSPTEVGERLLQTVRPRFEDIETELATLNETRDKPAGTIRINAGEHPAISVLAPALSRLLPEHPYINVEITVDHGLTDIVSERYDAGVRLGKRLANDMIAVRIGPDVRWVVAATPAYFATHARPETPDELTAHNCINMRFPTYDDLHSWGFEKDGRQLRVRVEGQLVFNTLSLRREAALAGLGLAYLPEDQVAAQLADGRLIQVLADWCPRRPGYHLYYPNRHQHSAAFRLLLEALRYHE